MKRTLICTLEIDLGELPDNERAECAKMADTTPDNLPSLANIEPHELSECIESAIEQNEEFFSGSGLFAKIEVVRVSEHGWKTKLDK